MTATSANARRPLALAIVLALASASANAATITVTSGGDPDPASATTCTLRQAILSANDSASQFGTCTPGDSGGNTIEFDPALAGATITLSYDSPVGVIAPLTIEGSNQTIIGPNSRYAFFSSSDLAVSNLTISGADHSGGLGGAFRLNGGSLTLTGVTLSGNKASLGGWNFCQELHGQTDRQHSFRQQRIFQWRRSECKQQHDHLDQFHDFRQYSQFRCGNPSECSQSGYVDWIVDKQ